MPEPPVPGLLAPGEAELLPVDPFEAKRLGSMGWPGVQGTPSEVSLDVRRMRPGTKPDGGQVSTGTRVDCWACICWYCARGTQGWEGLR